MANSVEAEISDEEVNPKTHKKLLESISRLGKNQHIKKPTRREPTLKQDEFHLVKSSSETVGKVKDSSVSVNDLVQLLNKTNKHLDFGKELKNTARNKKVLQKPLEKNEADKIRSLIGYEKAKKKVSRWDAVVTRNRVAEQQVFPLDSDELHIRNRNFSKNKSVGLSLKSDLMLEMEAIEKKLRALKGDKTTTEEEEDEKKIQERLTREELIARRKELAYLRIRESQQSAKARFKNKIKSKKYHKFLKREKLKEQMKEFEILQKMNPEAALEKLEKLEKNRVLERASLRHKNTGTWAKNLQIRAKYDKDVRKDLAEQLAISRELTEKKQKLEEDEEENGMEGENQFEEDANEEVDPFNPWVKKHKKEDSSNEVANFVSGYRKYWLERNKNEKDLLNYRKKDDMKKNTENNEEDEVSSEKSENSSIAENLNDFKVLITNTTKSSLERKLTSKKKSLQKHKRENKENGITKISNEITLEDGWIVEDLNEDLQKPNENSDNTNIELKDIDDIFDEAEDLIQDKVTKKLEEFRKKFSKENQVNKQKKNRNVNKTKKNSHLDLSFKQKPSILDADEGLNETTEIEASTEQTLNESLPLEMNANNKMGIENNSSKVNLTKANKTEDGEIDPNKFVNIKPKMLQSSLPEEINQNDFFNDECDDNDVRRITISEAFQDDDIVAEFEKDREEEKKSNINEIDLTLPGWGSWAGCGISETQKKKRLILKLPEEQKRRDENKQNVYINENENKKLKEHLISDLPFPFTCVQDFEASIRTPVGRTSLPESAFRMLTRPSVITKRGQIIEPMDESVLMKAPKRPRNVVDARIEKMNKKKKKVKS